MSLTLTPMMCARLLRAEPPGHRPNALFRWSERGFDAVSDGYVSRPRLGAAPPGRHACCSASPPWSPRLVLYATVQKGFLPQQDTGLLVGTTDAAAGHLLRRHGGAPAALAEAIARDPDVAAVDSFVGAGTVNPTLNSGRLYIDIGSPGTGARRRRR